MSFIFSCILLNCILCLSCTYLYILINHIIINHVFLNLDPDKDSRPVIPARKYYPEKDSRPVKIFYIKQYKKIK